jgi:hypothetical protein
VKAWLVRLLERRATKVAAIALASKIARMAWAVMVRGERFAGTVVSADLRDPAWVIASLNAREGLGPGPRHVVGYRR